MTLTKDLKEFVALLNAANVKYLLVDGHAVAFHGHPRFTGDIDFYVEPTLENGSKLAAVFTDFGFGELGFRATDFTKPGTVIQIGRPLMRAFGTIAGNIVFSIYLFRVFIFSSLRLLFIRAACFLNLKS